MIAKLPVSNEWDTVDLVITCIHNFQLKRQTRTQSEAVRIYDTEKCRTEMHNRSFQISCNFSQGVNHSCVKHPQLVGMAVKVNAPTIGLCPVPFTMFPFSNVARFRLQLQKSKFCCLCLFLHSLYQ